MSDGNKGFLRLLLGLTSLGSIGDGFTTMITLLSIFRGTNMLTYIFAILGGIFITALTANHSATFANTTPASIKIVGAIAVLLDVLTSFVGTTYYIALGHSIGGPIDWSLLICCDWPNLFPTIAAFGLAAMFNISTLSIVNIYSNIKKLN